MPITPDLNLTLNVDVAATDDTPLLYLRFLGIEVLDNQESLSVVCPQGDADEKR
jgi:hypothetical protein